MSRAPKRKIEERVDLRLTPTEASQLRRLARERTTNNSKPDTLRKLISDAYEALTAGEQARGEDA